MLHFSMIQLMEYFIWKDQECTGQNQFYSKIAWKIIMTQPLFTHWILSHKKRIYFILGAIFNYTFVIYTYLYYNNNDNVNSNIIYNMWYHNYNDQWCTLSSDTSVSSSYDHLVWRWFPSMENHFLWNMGFVTALIYPILLDGHRILFLLNVMIYSYSVYNFSHEGTYSSMWCWYANILPLLAHFGV